MELPSLNGGRAVIHRYARVVARLEEDLGKRPLVLPDTESFPDTFTPDERGLRRLLARMQRHAGMSDIPIDVVIAGIGDAAPSSGCGTGCTVPARASEGLERVVDEGDGWTFRVPAAELKHPVALTANLARALAYAFLIETKAENEVIEPPVDVTADLTGVALGFGALLLEGSYIYAKSCGGPSVVKLTKLSCAELAIVYALFVAAGDHPRRRALKELGTTQRALVSDAFELLDSNQNIVQQLKAKPRELAQGAFELSEAKPWLGRLFNRKKKRSEELDLAALGNAALDDVALDDAELAELESLLIDMPPSSSAGRPSQAPASRKHQKELRKLVDEAFGPVISGSTR